jgi:O-antigen ligase
LVGVALQTKSAAGAGLAIVLLLVGALALLARLSAPLVAGLAGLAIVLVVALTVVLGHDYHPGRTVQPRVDRVAARALTYRRIELWHDALVITAHHPGLGVGPQRFAVVSPTARSDRDARWAHSGPLQQVAEAGIPGALLLAALFAWALVITGLTRTSQAAIAAAAVGALGVHAGIDYVLQFLVVPVAAGGVVGSAVAGFSPRRLRSMPKHRSGTLG